MPAITPATSSQAPSHIEDNDASDGTEWETNAYQKKPDVVLTGFGPFLSITVNSSFEIAQALPPSLKSADGSGITLKAHPEAVHVGYDAVLQLIPELYTKHIGPSDTSNDQNSSYHDLPFFIHIGAGNKGMYEVEQMAHRDGYWREDVDGKAPPTREHCEGRGYPCKGEEDPLSPPTLQTGIDVPGVIEDVKGDIPDLSMPIDPCEDAGNYTCDFIYYTSLREARLRCGDIGLNKVLFVHVPPDGTVEEGVKVLSAVIKSVMRREKARTTRAS